MTDFDDGLERSPAETEQAIRQTRVELGTTLDALERKLAARHLVEKGIDMLKDSFDSNDVMNRSLDIIRANPIPVALIGLGAAWLVANNTGVVDRIAQDDRVDAARRRVTGLATDIGNRAGEIASDVADKVGLRGSAADRPLGHTGNPMVDHAPESGDGWMHQVSDMAHGALRTARDSSGAAFNYAGDGASRVADQVSGAFERNPLVIGAIGVMAGALLAALLPVSRFENNLMGETRDDLWQKAGAAGEQAVERVRDAASQAAVRAVDAAADTAAETVRSIGDKTSPTG